VSSYHFCFALGAAFEERSEYRAFFRWLQGDALVRYRRSSACLDDGGLTRQAIFGPG
jgi:hypothetical protein